MRADILTEHAEEIEVLWARRAQALRSPREDLDRLEQLEARLEAHIAGLALDLEGAHPCFAAGLTGDDAEAAFASAAALLHQRLPGSRRRVLDALAAAGPAAARGIGEAFAYLPLQAIVAAALLEPAGAAAAPARAAALAALGAHASLPGAMLARALVDPQPLVRRAAARAAGAIGADASALRYLAGDDDPGVRAAAIAALARRGEPDALERAREAVRSDPVAHAPLLTLLGRLGDAGDVPLLHAAANEPALAEAAIRALGATGRAEALPPLLERMRDARCAPAAGEAFRRITGMPPVPAPAQPVDEDAHFHEVRPWPDPDATQQLWRAHAAGFASAPRWRLGRPIDARDWLAAPQAGDLLTRREEITRLRAGVPGALGKLDLDAPAARQRNSTT